jgi:hypothetical protein
MISLIQIDGQTGLGWRGRGRAGRGRAMESIVTAPLPQRAPQKRVCPTRFHAQPQSSPKSSLLLQKRVADCCQKRVANRNVLPKETRCYHKRVSREDLWIFGCERYEDDGEAAGWRDSLGNYNYILFIFVNKLNSRENRRETII